MSRTVPPGPNSTDEHPFAKHRNRAASVCDNGCTGHDRAIRPADGKTSIKMKSRPARKLQLDAVAKL
jgi:hypothetical protein